MRIEIEANTNASSSTAGYVSRPPENAVREVKATSAQLATDPGLGGFFEVVV